MSIRLPVDASQNVQAAFRDVEQELEDLKAVVASLSGGTDLTAVHERIDKIQPPPQLNSDEHTFVGAGSQHSVGLVPDPGTSGGDTSRVLGESGGWVYQNVGKLAAADQNSRGTDDIYQVPGSLAVTSDLSAGSLTTATLSVHGSARPLVIAQDVSTVTPATVRAFTSSSGTGKVPTLISGCTGWWKADAGVYSDAGTTPAADTNTVQQWNDQSGNGRNLTQATAGFRPTYRTGILNSLPVIRFGGGTDDDFLESIGVAISNFITNSAKTIFFVGKHSANASAGIMGSNAGEVVFFEWNTTGTKLDFENNDGVYDSALKTGAISGTYYIGSGMHSGGTIYCGLNDTRTASMTTAASGNTTALTDTYYCGRRGGNYLDGDIAEIIIFNVALSEADRKQVETYLAVKYALTLPYTTTDYGSVNLFQVNDPSNSPLVYVDSHADFYVQGVKIN